MEVDLTKVILYSSALSVIIPLLIYASKIKIAAKEIHIIGGLLIASGASDLIGFLQIIYFRTNAVTSNIYELLEFYLLSWLYFEIVFKRYNRGLFLVCTLLFVLAFLTITFFVTSFWQHQRLVKAASAFIFIIYAMEYSNKLLLTVSHRNSEVYSLSWINNGILFYFSFNLFVFVTFDYIVKNLDLEISKWVWSFHNLNNIVKNILFAIGIFYAGRRMIVSK